MELRNLYVVNYIIDGCKNTDLYIFDSPSLAERRKERIEVRFSTNPDFEGAVVETHKLVYDRNCGIDTVYRVDYIKNSEIYSSMFYNSSLRAEKKYNEIMNTIITTDIELEKFNVISKQKLNAELPDLEY